MADLRSWLEKTAQAGDLKEYTGADWNLDIAYLTTCNWKKDDAPALLFDKIKGYPEGFRVLTSSIRTQGRVASVLNVPVAKTYREQLQILRGKVREWDANIDKFAPVTVAGGPVLENIQEKDDVDVFKFPVPLWHEKDGGRYIGTGDAMITHDPDTGEVNIGTYRVMIHDKKHLGLYLAPGRHARLHLEKHHAQGKPCPIALSVGHHPLLFIVASQECPPGTEYNYLGAIQGSAQEVIKEEITGLPIPADSEMVIVGWCKPGDTKIEGPFGEFTGYYASGARPGPIIEVERVYFRNNPIILGSPPGRPPNETSLYYSLVRSAMLHNQLELSGVPDITGVCCHEWRTFFIAVSLRQRYAGHAKQAALLTSELTGSGGIGPKYILVVDEDIDVTNIRELLWALCTRSDPSKSIDIIRNVRSSPLDPAIRKSAEEFSTSRAILDACRPFGWRNEFPEVIDFSPAIRKAMYDKWGEEC